MNFQFYLEKLNSSDNFKSFMKKNPGAFLCSGFFIIDKQGIDNKQHLDFYLPSSKKIYSFQLENNMQLVPIESRNDIIPEKISMNCDFDFDEIENLISQEKEKHNIKNKIQKILLSLQKVNGKDFLIGTAFISSLGLIKINIDLSENKITDFKKKSFFDIMNVFKKK